MLDWVPGGIWLLIALGAIGSGPALYVFRYLQATSKAREVGAPLSDESYSDQGALIRCLAVLVALTGLAIFSFTKAAEDFVHSPRFPPLLAAAMAVCSFYWTIDGFVKGEVEPLIRGQLGPYNRVGQPKRYWCSMAWNVFVSVIMTGCAFMI
jgi:hypothetical protein